MSVIRDLLDSTKLLLNDSLATTGSNIFVGTQTLSGSIIPAADNIYDLGSPTQQWRDLYLSSASLYIDGTKVISSNTDTLTFTTDAGQSIKLLETGGDDITLQTDTGNIELKGTVEIESGKKITDSAGTMINFGDSIAVTGSIETTGTVDGIDLQAFSSSVAEGFANTTADYTELTNIPAGIVSSSSQITITESQISDLTHYTDSDVKTKLNSEGVVSGSSQVDYTAIQNTPTTITAQQASDITTNNAKVGYTNSLVKTKLDTENVVSGSSQITTLLNGEDLTLANLTVNGAQTILDSTRLAIGDNIIELNGGGATNGGLLIKDVTAPNNVSGSLLWDSTNDYWIGGPLGSESKLLRATGDNIISGSSQVDYNSIQNKPTNVSSFTNDAGYLTSYTDTNTTYTAGTNLTLTGTEFSLNSSPTLTGLTTTGNVGIGTSSPAYNLTIEDTTDAILHLKGSDLGRLYFGDAASNNVGRIQYYHIDNSMQLYTNSAERMRIDSSGNVGIGNTPTSWNTVYRSLQIGIGASISGRTDDHLLELGSNSYRSTSGTWKYITSNSASRQDLSAGQIRWYNASSGTAGNDITWSEAMRIDSSGNVGIGTTTVNATYLPKLQITGTANDGTEGVLIASYLPTLTFQDQSGGATIGQIQQDGTGLVFKNNAAERMRIDSSGNVGIGTSSPGYKLEIAATSTNQKLFRISHPTAPTEAGFMIGFNTDGTVDDNVVSLGVEYSSVDYDVINIQRSTRNVGIGVIADTKLDVYGDIKMGTTANSNFKNRSESHWIQYNGGSTTNDTFVRVASVNAASIGRTISFHTNTAERMRITSDGRVGIGTTNPTRELDVTGPGNVYARITAQTDADSAGLELANTQNTWTIFNTDTADDNLEFNSSTVSDVLVLQKTGNVGIGTSSPSTALQVDGTVTATLVDAPIKETRAGESLSFWKGTQAQYDALSSYDNNTIYFTT